MLITLILVSLSLTTSINGTGNMSIYESIGKDYNTSINMTGIISMETNHVIEGIPDTIPALEPRYPMIPPSR